MKRLLYLTASFLLGCIATAIFLTERNPPELTVATVTIYDTIPCYYPVPRDSVVIRYETHRLPEVVVQRDTIVVVDSVNVIVPITQKEYQDSTYHLWISGYAPNLDSIYTYTRYNYTTITHPPPKPKRWHFGITVGFGITPKGLQPYIGGGVTYSIKSF